MDSHPNWFQDTRKNPIFRDLPKSYKKIKNLKPLNKTYNDYLFCNNDEAVKNSRSPNKTNTKHVIDNINRKRKKKVKKYLDLTTRNLNVFNNDSENKPTHDIELKFETDCGFEVQEEILLSMVYFTEFIEKKIIFDKEYSEKNCAVFCVNNNIGKKDNAKFELSIVNSSGKCFKAKDDEIIIVKIAPKVYEQTIQLEDNRLIKVQIKVSDSCPTANTTQEQKK